MFWFDLLWFGMVLPTSFLEFFNGPDINPNTIIYKKFIHAALWPQTWIMLFLFPLSEGSSNLNSELSYAATCLLVNRIVQRHSCVFILIMPIPNLWMLLNIRETKGLILCMCMTCKTVRRNADAKIKRCNLHYIICTQKTIKWSEPQSQTYAALPTYWLLTLLEFFNI